MRIISAAPVLPKPKPITGVGDAKQLSPSFTRPVQTRQPNNGVGYFYSGSPGSDAARAPYYPTIGDTPAKTPTAATTPTTKTPAGPAAGSNPGAPGAGQSIYDLSTDPIVQKIRSLNQSNYGQSVASADSARKRALIDAGFADIARASQFGSLDNPTTGDEATALAASANPYSLAMQLARTHLANQENIDKTAGANNTYFSSTRANQLGDEGRQYLGDVSSAEGTLRDTLNGILSGLVGTRSAEQQSEADAISQARSQAVQNAISSGQSFIGYDAKGNPIFGNPASADTSAGGSAPPNTSSGSPSAALLRAGIGAGGALNTVSPSAPASSAAAPSQAIQNALAAKRKQLIAMFG
jgi:hypothetical protein